MRVITLIGALLTVNSAGAQILDELTVHHRICEAHRIGARIDKYVEGFEACDAVQKAWRASEAGKIEAEQKAKAEADKAKINDFAKGLSK